VETIWTSERLSNMRIEELHNKVPLFLYVHLLCLTEVSEHRHAALNVATGSAYIMPLGNQHGRSFG